MQQYCDAANVCSWTQYGLYPYVGRRSIVLAVAAVVGVAIRAFLLAIAALIAMLLICEILEICYCGSLFCIRHVCVASHHLDLAVDKGPGGGQLLSCLWRSARKRVSHVTDGAADVYGRRWDMV
jgi:hypothetical protein